MQYSKYNGLELNYITTLFQFKYTSLVYMIFKFKYTDC